jgi:hypothetical protein
MVLGGSECPQLLSAISGYVVGGARVRETRLLECETQVTYNHFSMRVNACTARRNRVRRFERSILLRLGILGLFREIFKFSVLRRRALWP